MAMALCTLSVATGISSILLGNRWCIFGGKYSSMNVNVKREEREQNTACHLPHLLPDCNRDESLYYPNWVKMKGPGATRSPGKIGFEEICVRLVVVHMPSHSTSPYRNHFPQSSQIFHKLWKHIRGTITDHRTSSPLTSFVPTSNSVLVCVYICSRKVTNGS